MKRRLLLTLVLVAPVAGAVLWAPPTSFACSGGPSAVNVYTECLQTAGGEKRVGQAIATPSASSRTAKILMHAGKDGPILSALLHGYGSAHLLRGSTSQTATATSALGSAFDPGSGPAALLIGLAGITLLVLGGSGLRGWRKRRDV